MTSFTHYGGTVTFNNESKINQLNVGLGTGRFNVYNSQHWWNRISGGNQATDTFDITGSTINSPYFAHTGSSNKFITDNSEVNIVDSYNSTATPTISASSAGFPFNRLIIYEQLTKYGAFLADTLIFEVGSGIDRVVGAGDISVGYGVGGLLEIKEGVNMVNSGYQIFNIDGAVTTNIIGNCEQRIGLKTVTFNFASGAGALLSADYMALNGVTAAGPDAPFNAGANSIELTASTNTGWTINPSVGRTLYWMAYSFCSDQPMGIRFME